MFRWKWVKVYTIIIYRIVVIVGNGELCLFDLKIKVIFMNMFI